jgi:hypothetical protein
MEYAIDKSPTQKQFLANMEEKLFDRQGIYGGDTPT